jgi:serine/threonine protein kinase
MDTSPDFAHWIKHARRQIEDIPRLTPTRPGENADEQPFLPGYDRVRELARGGQGVVYLARQQGTKQLVAIKMVKEGPFSSHGDRIRFEREIEVLGALNHPNIVVIHDSGAVSGCLYCVMDYLDGPQLDDHIRVMHDTLPDRQRVRDTLALIVDVCSAVHAAHLHGVIHRDLKPSNIRLDSHGRPVVLDFGLAKPLTDPGDATTEALTETGQFVGTINYASPEQVDAIGAMLDLRTDVYALGILIFELLTDSWPYDADPHRTVRQTFDAITESAPRRPSSISEHLDDDVDTLVLKCLDKDPGRRYQSAGDLAEDIRRYLADEPIAAKRDSTLYVLRKNIRRHRAAVLVSGLIVVILAVATGVLSVMYSREQASHHRAQHHYDQVRSLAHTLIFDIDEHVRPLAGSTSTRQHLVNTGLQYLDQLATDTEALQPETLFDLATAYLKTGDIQGGLNRHNLGDTNGARASYAKAMDIAATQYALDPDNPVWIDCLANARIREGDMLTKEGDTESGLRLYKHALELADTLPRDVVRHHRTLSICITRMGNGRVQQRRFDDGLVYYERALQLSRALHDQDPSYLAHSDIAVHEYKIGRVLLMQGHAEDALSRFQAAIDIREELIARFPNRAEQRHALASLLVDVGDAVARRGETDEAMTFYRNALAIQETLASSDSGNTAITLEMALNHERIGGLLINTQDLDGAFTHYDESLSLRHDVAAADPTNAVAQRLLAVAHEKVGNVIIELRRFDDGLVHFEASLDIRRELVKKNESSSEANRDLAVAFFKIGAACGTAANQQEPPYAVVLWQRAKSNYEHAHTVVTSMQDRGILAEGDAGIASMLTARIAESSSKIEESNESQR